LFLSWFQEFKKVVIHSLNLRDKKTIVFEELEDHLGTKKIRKTRKIILGRKKYQSFRIRCLPQIQQFQESSMIPFRHIFGVHFRWEVFKDTKRTYELATYWVTYFFSTMNVKFLSYVFIAGSIYGTIENIEFRQSKLCLFFGPCIYQLIYLCSRCH